MLKKINAKIGLIFFIFFVELIIFSSLYFFLFSRHAHEMKEIHEEIAEMDVLRELQVSLSVVVMPANDYLIAGAQTNEKENFSVLSAKVEDLIGRMEKMDFDRIEEKELFSHIKKEYVQAKKMALNIFSIPHAMGNKEAGVLMEEMDALVDHIINDADQFHKICFQEIEEAEEAWHRLVIFFNIIILTGIILTIIIILGGLFFLRRNISVPIISLRDSAMEVGMENLEKKVDVKSDDEIGDLAVAFNKMVTDLKMRIGREKEISKYREEALFAYEQNMGDYESEIKNLKSEVDNLRQALGQPKKH